MHTQTMLITNATHPLGEAIADQLAQSGYYVFGMSRRPDQAREAAYEPLLLDERDAESVAWSVAHVLRCTGRIDGLITTPSYGLAGTVEETTIEEAKALFETNFFGVLRLINAVLPWMREQRAGRILNVSAGTHEHHTVTPGFYTATSYALEGYTVALHHEVKPLGLHVSLVDASAMQPSLEANRTQRTIPDYHDTAPRRTPSAAQDCDPACVARQIDQILKTDAPRLYYTVPSSEPWSDSAATQAAR